MDKLPVSFPHGTNSQVVAHILLSNREKLGVDQVFVVWTSKSGLNQPTVV